LRPVVSIYSWDNKNLIREQYVTETTNAGLYTYDFKADSKFTPGKAYTYIASEQTTSGLVTGSGMVESMSMTTIAGLSASAPEAARAAKNALDAIKGLEAVLISGDNINIALTLKNLKDSIDALPESLSKEGPSSQIAKVINEIAERLNSLAGGEGYDFTELLEQALTESPTMKQVRSKTDAISAVVELLLRLFESKFGGVDTPIVSTSLQPGSIRFRIVAVNPSKTRSQPVQVKTYLPEEVKPKDIIDSGGLEWEYDA
jgi:hypothetical protein